MIRFDQVTASFAGRAVLRQLSFRLPDGGVLGLVGANGSGKSTVIKLVLGLIRPDAGRIEGINRRATAVFQEDRLCEQLSAVGNVRLVLDRSWSDERILDELWACGLSESAADRPVRQLSGGERRRVCLVRAMVAPGDIVCLDEPFNGIDYRLDQALAYVQERRRARDTIMVSHQAVELAGFDAHMVSLTDRDKPGRMEVSDR